jgi:DNA-binding MarR family transcriptional regulator
VVGRIRRGRENAKHQLAYREERRARILAAIHAQPGLNAHDIMRATGYSKHEVKADLDHLALRGEVRVERPGRDLEVHPA